MSKKRQLSLCSCQTSQSEQARIDPEDINKSTEFEETSHDNITVSPDVVVVSNYSEELNSHDCVASTIPVQSSQQCIAQCCSTDEETFQPVDKPT